MSVIKHRWKDGEGGRSYKAQPGGSILATMTCEVCRDKVTVRFRQLCDADEMDRKFEQRGFDMKKRRHRNCAPKGKDKDMATAPSTNAVRAQIKAMRLIEQHFDPDKGVYAKGWSDEKIAADVDLTKALVATYREEGFGPLKEPAEFAALAADIAAVEQLLDEAVAPIRNELAQIKMRLAELRQKFPA